MKVALLLGFGETPALSLSAAANSGNAPLDLDEVLGMAPNSFCALTSPAVAKQHDPQAGAQGNKQEESKFLQIHPALQHDGGKDATRKPKQFRMKDVSW